MLEVSEAGDRDSVKMLKRTAIIGFALFAIGGITLALVVPEIHSERELAAEYRLKYGSEHDEYLKRYNEWLKLSPAECSNISIS